MKTLIRSIALLFAAIWSFGAIAQSQDATTITLDVDESSAISMFGNDFSLGYAIGTGDPITDSQGMCATSTGAGGYTLTADGGSVGFNLIAQAGSSGLIPYTVEYKENLATGPYVFLTHQTVSSIFANQATYSVANCRTQNATARNGGTVLRVSVDPALVDAAVSPGTTVQWQNDLIITVTAVP